MTYTSNKLFFEISGFAAAQKFQFQMAPGVTYRAYLSYIADDNLQLAHTHLDQPYPS